MTPTTRFQNACYRIAQWFLLLAKDRTVMAEVRRAQELVDVARYGEARALLRRLESVGNCFAEDDIRHLDGLLDLMDRVE